MKIQVEIKNVYGVERIYPLTYTDELKALTGMLTITKKHIEALKLMGFEFEVKGASI